MVMNRRMMAGMAVMVIAVPAAWAAEQTDTVTAQATALHRAAIEDARAGRVKPALEVLQSLVARFPDHQDFLGDYVVVLGWAGDHIGALALIDRVNRVSAPAYVIDSLANSARRLQRYELAESLYNEALARDPARVEAEIDLARTLADAGKRDAASALIGRLREKFPKRVDVHDATADIASINRDPFTALAAYDEILALQPANRAALRGKIRTLAGIGAPQVAITLADRSPGALSLEERDALAVDLTAQRIRWGMIAADTGRGPQRFTGIDRALADSEAAGVRALDPATELTTTERRLALDRISALQLRFRMYDAVALHEAMAARPAAMPAYAQAAAAAAYLTIEQPEKARDLYRESLLTDPDNLDSQLGLFYALAENQEHEAALAQVERVVAATPPLIDQWSRLTIRENPVYARALAARAISPLFLNRPGEAEQRLQMLSAQAPHNMEIRTDYASVMRARGWPRAAEEELRWIIAADPGNSGALGERAGALLEMQDYRNAESALTLAQSVAAEDGRVKRAVRLHEVYGLRELIVDGNFGKSKGGGPTGTQDYAVDTRLYSSPLDYNYRVFAHAFNAEARFAGGTGRRNRVGGGLEYRSSLITASGELSHDFSGNHNGVAAAFAYTPSDIWTFSGVVDTSSNETPLQASLVGINARLISGEAVWQANESRSAALYYAHMDFSDNNRRDTTQARWTERVIAGPVYTLEITGALYASNNSLGGTTPYFNPLSDFSPTVELANEWVQWQRYTRSFRHRVVVTAGRYWQQGFGAGPVHGARYEQEWAADDRLTLRYGIGRNLHPYDGVKSARNYAVLSLNWRF